MGYPLWGNGTMPDTAHTVFVALRKPLLISSYLGKKSRLETTSWKSKFGAQFAAPLPWQSLFSLSTLVMGTRYMWTLLPDVLLTSCYLAKKSSLETMSLEKQIWRSVRGPTAPLAELVLVIIIHL